MAATLAEATARARQLLEQDHLVPALLAWNQVLTQQRLADDVRSEIAGALALAGRIEEAAHIQRSLCLHLMRAGRPLPAIAAAHALGPLGRPFDFLLEAIATMYAASSPSLAPFAARPAPLDPTLPVTAEPAPEDAEVTPAQFDRLVEELVDRAVDFSTHPPYQKQVHPIPFLSELAADSLLAVLQALRVKTPRSGDKIVQQGTPGTAIYLVASGRLRVEATGPDGSVRELAQIYENSLFGEMAVVTSQPRGASVIASENSVVLELRRDSLDEVRVRIPSIESSLARFARERLIRNLLATSPLFTPFTKDQQGDLLRRFEGIEVPPGTVVIREGDPGVGLYVVLSGDLKATAVQEGGEARVVLGSLGPGDVFGEMSLVSGAPASATVQTWTQSALMFLPRVYVDRLADAVPEVRTYFAGLAEQRSAQNGVVLAAVRPAVAPMQGENGDAGGGAT